MWVWPTSFGPGVNEFAVRLVVWASTPVEKSRNRKAAKTNHTQRDGRESMDFITGLDSFLAFGKRRRIFPIPKRSTAVRPVGFEPFTAITIGAHLRTSVNPPFLSASRQIEVMDLSRQAVWEHTFRSSTE